MKVCVLYSGGKDSTLAAALAVEAGYEVGCLVRLVSKSDSSFMFHVPSIAAVEVQARVWGVPLVSEVTAGVCEEELVDLRRALVRARDEHGVEGVVTGAILSVYQASRIQRVCFELGLSVFNPLWQRSQREILEMLVARGFEVIVVGVFAYGLDKSWLGRRIDSGFISDIVLLEERWGIAVGGEGGEYESLVLDCPLFSSPLRVVSFEDVVSGEHSVRRDVVVEVDDG